jgi:molybdopterin-guanine dinucleotide biosynthesis protein A
MTSTAPELRVGGIVLCGGQSTRMGRPKAWLPVGEELMLPRVVRIISEAVAPIVVVAAPGQDLPPVAGAVLTVRDARPGRGPLEGLAAGLRALKGRADAAFVSSCDVPLLRPSFVRRMIELLGNDQIAVPFIEGRRHPLAGVYRLDVLAEVEKLLAGDRLRVMDLFRSETTRLVTDQELWEVDPTLRSLQNVNTAEEYAAALAARELRS